MFDKRNEKGDTYDVHTERPGVNKFDPLEK